MAISNTIRPGRHFLQIPGPTNVPDRVLRAMDYPTIDHRGPDFAELGLRVLDRIKLIFKTSYKSILKSDFISLFRSMPEKLSLSVIKNNPSIYFENTISNVRSLIKDSDAINAIRECFEAKYNGRYTRKKDKSTISLTFEITTIENSDKISKIYPNFVHSSCALVLKDNWTQKNIYFQNIFESSGSDFNSVEKAGINSLKNLAKVITSKICS